MGEQRRAVAVTEGHQSGTQLRLFGGAVAAHSRGGGGPHEEALGESGKRSDGGISGARRVVAVAGVAIAGVVAVGAPAAQAAAQVDTFPVTWTLTSEVCPNLPAGTTITASGVERSVTSSPARPGGFLVNATHAQGTATDQDGNVYVFIYSNEFRVTPRADGSFVGLMTDHFSLSGAGPATLSNGFVAHITTDFETFFSFDPISAHGDPITFPDGEEVCDPL